jgi:hypothetical protein
MKTLQTIKTLRNAGDCTQTTIYVMLRNAMFGYNKGRLIGLGRKYARVLLADGRTLQILPEYVISVIK